MKKLSVLFFLSICLIQAKAQLCFNPDFDIPYVSTSPSIISADFNGDGKKDLAVGSSMPAPYDSLSVLIGDGFGNFGSPLRAAHGGPAYSLVSADFNGDSKMDLAFSEIDSIVVMLGTGTGSFNSMTKLEVGTSPWGVTTTDFNADGKADLAASSHTGIFILLGTGTGTFGTPTNVAAGNYQGTQIINSDFNGDGKPDLAVSSGLILLNNGSGGFTSGSFPAANALIVSADFNGDSKADLATCSNNNNTVSITLGTGTGSFNPVNSYTVGSFPFSIISADFNNDGHNDIATSNYDTYAVSIILGNGAGSFGAATQLVQPITSNTITATTDDFNGDNKPDIALTNCCYTTGNVDIILNCGSLTTGIYQSVNNTDEINIYPNPAKDKVYIKAEETGEIKLFDLLGSEIITTKTNEIDISSLSDGVYFMQIDTRAKIYTQKIIIQH